jgi:hypothetical protein
VHLEVRPGLALAKCGRLWPAAAGSGLAAAGHGAAEPGCGAAGPGCGAAGPGQVRPTLHPLVHPSMVHLSIVILISMYLQVKIPTQLVKLY